MKSSISWTQDLAKVIAPFEALEGVGKDFTYQSDFEWLDTEVMKVGSLSHESIEWNKIEELSIRILAESSKDLRVLSFLMQALQQKGTWSDMVASLHYLAGFIDPFWEVAYPFNKSDKRSAQGRNRLLVQILKRSIQALEYLSNEKTCNADEIKALTEITNQLESVFKQHLIESRELSNLKRVIAQIGEQTVLNTTTQGSGLDGGQNKKAQGATQLDSMIDIDVTDTEFLPKLTRLFYEINEPLLALSIRRLSLWSNINEAPPHEKNGETTLSSPSSGLIAKYKGFLNQNNISLDEWAELEESLTKAPFWLEGHYISAQIISALKGPLYADIIREYLKKFIEKIPNLISLTFNNGVPFISVEAKAWVNDESRNQSSASLEQLENDHHDNLGQYQSVAWNHYEEEVEHIYQNNGFYEALQTVHSNIASAINLREKTMWQWALSRLFFLEKMPEIASQNDQLVLRMLHETTLNEWEPQLFERVLEKNKVSSITFEKESQAHDEV